MSDEQISKLTYPELIDLIKRLADECELRMMSALTGGKAEES